MHMNCVTSVYAVVLLFVVFKQCIVFTALLSHARYQIAAHLVTS